MRKQVFYGKVKDGKLVLDHKAMFKEYMKKQKDCDVEVEVKNQSKDPSIAQWAYLYANVYNVVADYFGWEIDDVDTWMKLKFMKDNGIVLPDGLILTKTVFDRVWLAKYVDSCIRYAAMEGVTVAPPKLKGK